MYCEPSDVRSIIHTGLSDEQLGGLIVLVDAELDQKLGSTSLSSDLKKLCSMLLTAVLAAQRDPETYAVGSARIAYGPRITNWKGRANQIIMRAMGRWQTVDPLED